MSVGDTRDGGFIWAKTSALAHLAAYWNPRAAKASSGRSVYIALTEIANDHKARTAIGADASSRFRTSQKEIAERAIVSDRTAAKCCEELERIGMLVIETDRDGENRPGRPSFYFLVEPEQRSEEISDVEGDQRTKPLQTSSEAVSDVPAEGTKNLRTSLYREKKNNKKGRSRETTTATVVVPSQIEAPLRQAAEAKDAPFDPAAVLRACERFDDRDLVEEAERFAAWHVHRKPNAPLRDVAAAFRNWLSRADESPGAPGLATLMAAQPSPATGDVAKSDRAEEAWRNAKDLLESRLLEPSAFPLYIDPLVAVGERDGKLILLDTSSHGGGAWFTRKYRPLALEFLDGFDDIEIVDETTLEYEAR